MRQLTSTGERVERLSAGKGQTRRIGRNAGLFRRREQRLNLLALDTSSNACTVALQTGSQVTHRRSVEPRAHTRVLLPMITELLADSDIRLTDLSAIVLGNGPGSFIGMRIGASVAQGLSFGAGIDIVPVSSLAAVAAEAFAYCDAGCVVVLQDARMQEVYMGVFERDDSNGPIRIGEEQIAAVGALSIERRQYAAAGAGWDHYPELKAANEHSISSQVAVSSPDARYLLTLGGIAFNAGERVAPARLKPAYLRAKVAEIPARKN